MLSFSGWPGQSHIRCLKLLFCFLLLFIPVSCMSLEVMGFSCMHSVSSSPVTRALIPWLQMLRSSSLFFFLYTYSFWVFPCVPLHFHAYDCFLIPTAISLLWNSLTFLCSVHLFWAHCPLAFWSSPGHLILSRNFRVQPKALGQQWVSEYTKDHMDWKHLSLVTMMWSTKDRNLSALPFLDHICLSVSSIPLFICPFGSSSISKEGGWFPGKMWPKGPSSSHRTPAHSLK